MCWPFVVRCLSFNYEISSFNKTTGLFSYKVQFGPYKLELLVTGELVFFIPAPTIVACKNPRVESNLVAGMFLDY